MFTDIWMQESVILDEHIYKDKNPQFVGRKQIETKLRNRKDEVREPKSKPKTKRRRKCYQNRFIRSLYKMNQGISNNEQYTFRLLYAPLFIYKGT